MLVRCMGGHTPTFSERFENKMVNNLNQSGTELRTQFSFTGRYEADEKLGLSNIWHLETGDLCSLLRRSDMSIDLSPLISLAP